MSFELFLSAFQKAKKELAHPDKDSFAQRLQKCQKFLELIHQNTSELCRLDPGHLLFSAHFYQEHIIRASQNSLVAICRDDLPESNPWPTGVLGAGFQTPFFLRLFLEFLGMALVTGNMVLLKPWESQIPLAQFLRQLITQAGFREGSFEVLPPSAEVSGFLFQHPGVRGICWMDSKFSPDLLPTGSLLLEKKWRIHRGGKCTALVLADADLDLAAAGILRAVSEGMGSTSWNISRVIAHESVEKILKEKLLLGAQELRKAQDDKLEASQHQWVCSLVQEQARLVESPGPLSFLENVSNCSEAHQVELGSPVVFLMSVKYTHEMQRWVNNTATSLGVQIWGSREKYLKLAEQLQAARIWWQDWIEADPSLFYGQGASVFGGSELTLFGDFLTEHRKFDKRTSKNR